MDKDGRIQVWILDSWYVHGCAFYNADWTSFRQVRRFLVKYDWIPKHYLLDVRLDSLKPKKFRIRYPKPGESATTYFHACVVTSLSISTFSGSMPIAKAGPVDPTEIRRVS